MEIKIVWEVSKIRMKLVIRSTTGKIQRWFDEGDLMIGIGAQSSRWRFDNQVSRFNEFELDKD